MRNAKNCKIQYCESKPPINKRKLRRRMNGKKSQIDAKEKRRRRRGKRCGDLLLNPRRSPVWSPGSSGWVDSSKTLYWWDCLRHCQRRKAWVRKNRSRRAHAAVSRVSVSHRAVPSSHVDILKNTHQHTEKTVTCGKSGRLGPGSHRSWLFPFCLRMEKWNEWIKRGRVMNRSSLQLDPGGECTMKYSCDHP